MSFSLLKDEEQNIIFECVKAAVEGPFFPDWEFHALFRFYRNEIAEFVENWSSLDYDSRDVKLAINNSLNNLTGYPHQYFDAWEDYLPANRKQVNELFRKWRAICL
ncbi:MAG: hypothetical protein F6K16_31445 [Symploca sp. SIO2B6]|nr:hypothetical protein [Symploca sp. SIO2B6]